MAFGTGEHPTTHLCYGCSGCETYPTQPVVFSENKLAQAGRELSVPGKM